MLKKRWDWHHLYVNSSSVVRQQNWMRTFNDIHNQSNRHLEFQNLACIGNSLKLTWDLIPSCCYYFSKYSQSSSTSDFVTLCAHFATSWQSQRHPLIMDGAERAEWGEQGSLSRIRRLVYIIAERVIAIRFGCWPQCYQIEKLSDEVLQSLINLVNSWLWDFQFSCSYSGVPKPKPQPQVKYIDLHE